MSAQHVHKVAHGVQFPPEAIDLQKLWVAEKKLFCISVESGQSAEKHQEQFKQPGLIRIIYKYSPPMYGCVRRI